MIYWPDFGFHGAVISHADAVTLQREPCLTLCTLDNFALWGGPLSKQVFSEIARSSPFQRVAARAKLDSKVSIRISVYVVWLEPFDVPSQRPDWHIDRVGALRREGEIELVDLRDPLGFPAFILSSLFETESKSSEDINSPSTEFLLTTIHGKSPELWADTREMHNDIDSALAKNPEAPISKAGNRTIASFSPRTVHRPGQATTQGWRYLMRLGLYTTEEPCSPYPDHMVFHNPVWNAARKTTLFRRVGHSLSTEQPQTRSVSLNAKNGQTAAARFVEENSLQTDGAVSIHELTDLVDAAADKGFRQIGWKA